jgi:hypothetical protein
MKIQPFVFFLFLLLTGGFDILTAQDITDPSQIRTLPAPDSDDICTLDHTDVNAHFSLRPEPHQRQRFLMHPEADFQATYVNSCGSSQWPDDAIEAFEYALSIWSTHVESDIPIRVEAVWNGNINSLGSAGPTRIVHSSNITGAKPDTWYPIAQASAMAGIDYVSLVDARPDDEESYDMVVNINCSTSNWYFGTDANPGSNQIDLITVILHEIAHGLGFLGTMEGNNSTSSAEWGIDFNDSETPIIYDRIIQDGFNDSVLNQSTYPNPSEDLYQAVTGQRDGLFYSGENSTRLFTGNPVPVYAPSTWRQGSSYAHVDDLTFSRPENLENALMRSRIDQAFALHSPGPVLCGIMADKEWPMGSSCREYLDRDAMIAVAPDSIDFNLVNVGTPADQTITISNSEDSESPLQVSIDTNGNNFTIIDGAGNFSINPGLSLNVTVRFDPQTPGIKNGMVTIHHNAINEITPFEVLLTGEALESDILAKLEQNFPNPFQSRTQINYGLPQDSNVRIDLYSVNGQRVKTLVNDWRNAGDHELLFDAGSLSSGMYFYRIVVDGYSDTKKLLLVR